MTKDTSGEGNGNRGPLHGARIVEMTGIGPVPYAATVLGDLGADIVRIERPGGYPPPAPDLDFAAMDAAAIFYRSRPELRIDLKSPEGRDTVRRLIAGADAVIEGYRPGVMERLGLGPEDCLRDNPALVYVRITGWGQNGPLAARAGHDLNYLALSGALSYFGREGAPPIAIPPLLGDMASGALFGVVGLLAGVLSARTTGRGQVVDANIVDGSAHLCTLLTALGGMGLHKPPFGANTLDGGHYYYRTYVCADGGAVAVGAIEPAFRKTLLELLNLDQDPRFRSGAEDDNAYCTEVLRTVFATLPRDHWRDLFRGTDGCVTPVLSPEEAAADAHCAARGTFVTIDGVTQAAPAPRFSATPGRIGLTPREATKDSGPGFDWPPA